MAASRKLVLILGMHRSGTSCLAGMLRTNGLYLGTDIQNHNNFNKRGNQEHQASRKINRELMELNGGNWYAPRDVKEVPDPYLKRIESVKADLGRGGHVFGIKDPRLLFTLDMWEDERTLLVGTIRHPYSVFKSLERRNEGRAVKVDADWYQTWYLYNRKLLARYNERRFPIVNFNWPEDRYKAVVNALSQSLGLAASESFFDLELRHQEVDEAEVPAVCLELYEKLKGIAELEAHRLLSA